jgi:hypothetical protein
MFGENIIFERGTERRIGDEKKHVLQLFCQLERQRCFFGPIVLGVPQIRISRRICLGCGLRYAFWAK